MAIAGLPDGRMAGLTSGLATVDQFCNSAIRMDFYVILGLERAATLGDVKRAYRRLARRFHPDINPGDRTAAAQFRQIVEAYETLSDPDRRRRYDTVGPAGPAAAAGTFGRLTSTVGRTVGLGTPRQVQLALRLNF